MKATLTMLLATALPLQAQGRPPVEPQDPAQIIAKYVAALGGETAIRRVGSRHVVAELSMPAQAITGSVESYAAAPDLLRVRTTLPGFGRMETGYNGSVGWSDSEVAGAAILVGKQLDQLRASGDLLAPLHANVRSLTLIGVRDFEGRKAAAVAVISHGGDSTTEYFDVESNLLIGLEQSIATPGGDVPATTSFTDYRAFDDVLIPTTLTQRLPGGQVMVTKITNVDQQSLERSVFTPPPSVLRLIRQFSP